MFNIHDSIAGIDVQYKVKWCLMMELTLLTGSRSKSSPVSWFSREKRGPGTH